MKLVILDRDGVINHDSEHYIKSPEEWHPIENSLEAIAVLHQAGYTISVATNQSGIARNLYSEDTLLEIHAKMTEKITAVGGKIDSIFYCPHSPSANCLCRKPKPGLLEQIAAHYQTSLKNVPFVGDSYRDLQAADAVGAKGILVKTGNGTQTLQKYRSSLNEGSCFADLFEFATHLINQNT